MSSMRFGRKVSRRHVLGSAVAFVGVTAAGVLGAACAPADPTTPSPSSSQPAAAATPTQVMAKPAAQNQALKLSFWVNQPMARTEGLWEKLIKGFEAKSPGITIDSLIIPHNDYEPKILTGLASGDIGDVLDVHPVHQNTMAMRGALLPLDDYFKTLDFPKDDFTPAWNYQFWRGKFWSVPRSDNPTVILYNRKMVTEAGLPDPVALYNEGKWDLQAWDTMMATLSKGEGDKRVYGATVPGGGSLRSQCVWLWGNGAEIWNADETETQLASEPAIKAWEYMTEYVKKKWAPTPAEENIPGGSVALMGQRRVASDWPGAQFVLGGQAQYLPQDVQKEMHVVALNTLWNGKREVRNATNAQGTYPKSKFRDEAWKVHAYMLTEEVQAMIMAARWTAPLRKSWLKSDMWLKSLNKDFEEPATWEEAVLGVRDFAHVPRFVEIDKLVQTARDTIILGKATASQAMGELKPKVDRILQEVDAEVKKSPYLK